MKRYAITIEGRTFDVQVLSDPRREQVEVSVDGDPFTVGVQAGPAGEAPTGSTGEGSAGPDPANGVPAPVETPAASQQSGGSAAAQGRAVTAPLPGVVKSVDIRPGQQVAIGDQLLVLEAMKMDNVLRAAREGIVETIHAVEGHHVNHGDLLLEYE